MGTRENKVEKYLDKRIEDLGGLTRKWVSPGRTGVPDRIVILGGAVFFVEVKTVDGGLSEVQRREHGRLLEVGARVHTVYGETGVDHFIDLVTADADLRAAIYRAAKRT